MPRTIESPYPRVPPLPPANFHSWLFENPPANQLPKDHVLHVDGLTGDNRTFGQFLERIKDGATALAAPLSDDGLGVQPGSNEIVGILSPNCLVSRIIKISSLPFLKQQ